MNRKKFIRNLSLGAGVLAFSPIISACSKEKFIASGDFLISLPIPDEINAASFSLSAVKATTDISKDIRLSGFQINESFPSPTIRKSKGDPVDISFKNEIGQESIIHWHGFIIPPDMDGHPRDTVSSGQNYEYKFTVNQRAGTYWYHPHPDKLTGEQVYKGMAGFYIIEDEEEKALNLPSGKFEIPLIIQDRRVNSSGEIVYNPSRPEKMMTGILGDQILINGVPTPYHKVESSVYRLRLLNGSNARIYNIAFQDNIPYTVIGADGGLLPSPIETSELLLAPGERADILVDFSKFANNNVKLISKTFEIPSSGGMMGNMMGADGSEQGTGFSLMEFRIDKSTTGDKFTIPEQLSEANFPTRLEASKTRQIRLSMQMMQGHTINGKRFSMNRVDEQVKQGDTEIWEFVNETDQPHPMHVHAVQFKVLDRSGNNRGLTPTEKGWKDTVLVMPDERVQVIMKFTCEKGLYVFHCHNLEHEDNGMMANFEVI